MSYTQAEILVRYRRMTGCNIFYPMGFDDNGLPTERYVEQKHTIDKSKTSRPDFVSLCLKETADVTQTYRVFWRMLGLSVDWSLEYSTIHPKTVRVTQLSFIDLFRKGLVVRKEEPVMWDTSMTTTLSQADLEVIEKDGFLNYITFTAADGTPLTIATTRPELIPACVGIFCHPEDARYAHLIGKDVRIPLFDYSVKVCADQSVEQSFGTGLMMVCTFGDGEDVLKWKLHSLPTRLVLEEDGRLNSLAGQFQGRRINQARKEILEALKDKGLLQKQDPVRQRISVAERSKTPVEFVSRKQWFVKLLGKEPDFLRLGEKLAWFPEFFKQRYDDWVKGLKWDWCVSRQRFYGVPIPVWYCKNCTEIILPSPSQVPVDPSTSPAPVQACPKCAGAEFLPECDVFDTWMTSSLTPFINAEPTLSEEGDWSFARKDIFPMSLRVQGFEIIRTWLFYTLAKSLFHTGDLPWKSAVISGWGLDRKGHKISKSVGNYEDPAAIVQKYSSDALRYWAGRGALGADLRYNEEEVKNGSRLVIKLFNATRFLAMNLGVDYKHGCLEQAALLPVDRWILAEANRAIATCSAAFEQHDYSSALQVAEKFFWNSVCDTYMEMIKFRLRSGELQRADPQQFNYTSEEISVGQAVTFDVLWTAGRLLAPFVPFVTEYLYQGFFRTALGQAAAVSIHLSQWPLPLVGGDPSVLRHGEELQQTLQELWRAKVQNKIATSSRILSAAIHAPRATLEVCELSRREICSAVRADSISLVESDAFAVEIVPLPSATEVK
jgi:valyl-tRNA synthetase